MSLPRYRATRTPKAHHPPGAALSVSLRSMTLLAVLGNAVLAFTQSPSGIAHGTAATPKTLPSSCLARGRESEQISELLTTVRDHPTAGAYNTLGVLFAQADRLACAMPAFEASISLVDKNWEAHYNLGLALLRKGNRVLAATELQTAVRQKPDSAAAHFALGSLWQAEDKREEAAQEFNVVLTIDSQFVPASLAVAQVLMAQGKPAAAIIGLEKELEFSHPPEQVETLQVSRALAYAQNGQADKGVGILQEFVAAHPDSADAHLNLGLLYGQRLRAGDEDAAIAEYREALRFDPHLDAARISLGRTLLSQRKYSASLPVLEEYVSRKPHDDQGYYLLGLAYSSLSQFEKAEASLRKAKQLNPLNADAHYNLGRVLVRLGRPSEAIEDLQAAERINPDDPEVHSQLASVFLKQDQKDRAQVELGKARDLRRRSDQQGQAGKLNEDSNRYLLAGNWQAAVENYRTALKLSPNEAKLHYNLSIALDKLGDKGAEKEELESAVRLDPNLSVAHNQLGLLALGDGRVSEAEKDLKNAIQIDPRYAEAENNLGVLYSQEGKDAEAAELFRQAIQNDPGYVKAYVNLGLTTAKQGAFAQAEQEFQQGLKVDPNNEAAYAALGMLQAKTGRGKEAVDTFRKTVALDPESADAHLNLGIALVDQYDRTAGFKEFSEAVRLDPKLPAAHYNLGRFFYENGKYDEAERELETACHLQPNFASSLYFLALTEIQNNQSDRSTELLRLVIALRPDNADAQYLLGQNLERAGNHTEAVEHWKAAVESDPNHSQALYNLARTLNELHNSEAAQYQARFDALQKSQQITDRVKQLGNFALEAANAQNWPQAVTQTREAIQLCGDCSEGAHLHRNLGLFYGRTGRISEAEKELQTALDLQPNDAEAKKALTVLENLETAGVR
jgi:tetratricopeptide (TPR) repeat protein